MQSSERETRIQRAALVCMPPLSFSVFLSFPEFSAAVWSSVPSPALLHHLPRSFIPRVILNMQCRWQRRRMGGRAAEFFLLRSSGSSCDTRSLTLCCRLAPQRRRKKDGYSCRGDAVEIYYKFRDTNFQRNAINIYGAGVRFCLAVTLLDVCCGSRSRISIPLLIRTAYRNPYKDII